MALSNIFREPKREITESIVGLGLFSVYLLLDYLLSIWFQDITGGKNGGGCPWPRGMLFFGPVLTLILVILLSITHLIGEIFCDVLERHGVNLRSRNRP
jgi:hypothetical protein